MRKRRLLSAGLLLFLSAGLLASAPSGFFGKTQDQGQKERPKFYALRVVSEKNVQNAKDSLSAPDGRYAEILPGGQLVLLMEKKPYPFPFGNFNAGLGDSGPVIGKGKMEFGIEGWFPMQDTQGKQYSTWVLLGLSASGFCVWPGGSTGVDTIRITNFGIKSVFVDAVIGYALEAERK